MPMPNMMTGDVQEIAYPRAGRRRITMFNSGFNSLASMSILSNQNSSLKINSQIGKT